LVQAELDPSYQQLGKERNEDGNNSMLKLVE